MEINKISEIANVIAIISCKLKQEGYNLKNYGKQFRINPEFILEICNRHRGKYKLTIDDIYEATTNSFSHDRECIIDENEKYVSLKHVISTRAIIDYVYSIDIQPKHHLIECKPLYKILNPHESNHSPD